MIFVYFQKPYVTNAQTSGKIRPNERNTSKMEMSDNRLVLTKSPKIFIRATISPQGLNKLWGKNVFCLFLNP